jgi:hypothetical protein
VCADNDEETNCVTGTVRLLKVLLEDIPYVDNFIDDSVIYVLEVAAQSFDTLNDMIQVSPSSPHSPSSHSPCRQGKNINNQKVLIAENVVEVICSWIRLITPLSVELLRDLDKEGLLPDLKEIVQKSHPLSLTSLPLDNLITNLRWKMYILLLDIEKSALGFFFSLLNTNLPSEMLDVLQQIAMDLFVFRFKICWCGGMFRITHHGSKYVTGRYKSAKPSMIQQFKYLAEASHSLIRQEVPLKLSEIQNEVTTESSSSYHPIIADRVRDIVSKLPSFVPEALPLEDDVKELLIRSWAILRQTLKNLNLEISFVYYQFLETICQFSAQDFIKSLPKPYTPTVTTPTVTTTTATTTATTEEIEAKVQIDVWNEKASLWKIRTTKSLLTEKETKTFKRYFASIEIISPEEKIEGGVGCGQQSQQLIRVIFPVPRACWKQIHNPLVIREMERTIESVSRDSPQEKLDDFLDKSIQVRDVIIFQDWILEDLWTKHITKFITTRERLWIVLTMITTLYINTIILTKGKSDHGIGDQYLSQDDLNKISPYRKLHLGLSFLLVFNYSLGSAMVTINRGLSWKRNIRSGVVVLAVSQFVENMYNLCDLLFPNSVWAMIFILMDVQALYYGLFLTCSFLGNHSSPPYPPPDPSHPSPPTGNIYSVSFFSFHVLDLAFRIKLLQYVLKSVVVNINQVLTTLLLGIIICWMYTILGIYGFGFDQYEFPNMPDTDYEFPQTILSKFWQHLDFGLNGSPLWNSYHDYTTQKYLFDISYQIFIVVIMVAIITGIIIDTFADLRSERNFIEDDIANRCFICSIGREIFERNRIKFRDHVEVDHFVWNYLFYTMYLSSKQPTELTGLERWMKSQIKLQSTNYFPINKALSLERMDQENVNSLQDLQDTIEGMKDEIMEKIEKEKNMNLEYRQEMTEFMKRILLLQQQQLQQQQQQQGQGQQGQRQQGQGQEGENVSSSLTVT